MEFINGERLDSSFVSHIKIENSRAGAEVRFSYMEIFAVNSLNHHNFIF